MAANDSVEDRLAALDLALEDEPGPTYHRIWSADELSPERQQILMESKEPLEPWQIQPDPPDELCHARAPGLVKVQVGQDDGSGAIITWPDMRGFPAESDHPEIPRCERCKHKHITRNGRMSCNYHSRLGLPCRNPRVTGTNGCARHIPSEILRADRQRFLAKKELAKELADIEIEDIGNPIDRLAELAAQQLAWKDHLASIVSGMENEYRYTDAKGSEQLDSRVKLYQEALKESQRQLDRLVSLGFEEERLRLDERRAVLVTEFVTQVLQGLGLDPSQAREKAVIEKYLPILDGQPVKAAAIEATAWEVGE